MASQRNNDKLRSKKRSDQTEIDIVKARENLNEFKNSFQPFVEGLHPSMSEREEASGLKDTMAGRGPESELATKRVADERLAKPTFAEREAASGLTDTISGDREFYDFSSGGATKQEIPSPTDLGVYDATPPPSFTDDPAFRALPRTRIWKVDFGEQLNLDPFTLATKLLDAISDSLIDAIPSEDQIKSIIDQIFQDLTRLSTSPGSIASALEALFAPIIAIIDSLIDEVENLLDGQDGIRTSLRNGLNSIRQFPTSGDFICTPEFGNVYNVFDAGLVDENLIFRVKFTMDIDNQSKDYIAISTLPVPDVAALLKSVLKIFVNTISKGVSNSISGLGRSAFDGAVNGIKELYEELMKILQELTQLLAELSAQVSALFAQLSSLSGVVAANSAAILAIESKITILETAIATIEAEIALIEDRITAIEAQLALATDVEVIGADGNYTTMSVLENTPGTSAKREFAWVDSSTGVGTRSNLLVANNEPAFITPNIQDIDWRQLDYIHPTGATYQVYALVNINNASSGPVNPSPLGADYTKTSVAICEDGTTTTKDILTTTASP
jgi:ACT domain-containing protein